MDNEIKVNVGLVRDVIWRFRGFRHKGAVVEYRKESGLRSVFREMIVRKGGLRDAWGWPLDTRRRLYYILLRVSSLQPL